MQDTFQLLDVVALTEDLPERGLLRGQVGTLVVERRASQRASPLLQKWCCKRSRSRWVKPLATAPYDASLGRRDFAGHGSLGMWCRKTRL